MAGGTVLQMDKAKPQNQGFRGAQRQRREVADLDRCDLICAGRDHKKAIEYLSLASLNTAGLESASV